MTDTTQKKTKILITAGGTGGHLFPAESLARMLLAKGATIILATDKRGLKFETLGKDALITALPSATMRPGIIGKITALLTIFWGVVCALVLLLKHKPNAIVGFGGYPSFPAVFAGQLLNIPTIVHEQNGILGKANAFLSKRAHKIAASLPNTQGIDAKSQDKLVVTGNPARPEILKRQASPYTPPKTEGEINLFILGGSQGAKSFSTVIPNGIAKLPEALKKRLSITQQCREEDLTTAQTLYNDAGLTEQVTLASFFTDVPEHLKNCHLFIGRSGASTVTEVAIIGRPALFIPLKHADNQQVINAEALEAKGGAGIILPDDFNEDSFADVLEFLLADPNTLPPMAAAAQACANPMATQNLAMLVLTTAK